MEYAILIVMLVFMIGMMFMQTRRARNQQTERNNFRKSLEPGTEVITIGGIIGKVVEVDEQYEEIVLDSEGSQLRFSFNAINRAYVRPAYVSDDSVDENGNPLPEEHEEQPQDEEAAQIEPAVVEETTEETITETDEQAQPAK